MGQNRQDADVPNGYDSNFHVCECYCLSYLPKDNGTIRPIMLSKLQKLRDNLIGHELRNQNSYGYICSLHTPGHHSYDDE